MEKRMAIKNGENELTKEEKAQKSGLNIKDRKYSSIRRQ